MKPTTWIFVFLLFALLPASARQPNSQGQNARVSKGAGTAKQTTDDLDAFVQQYRAQETRKVTFPAIVPACKDLESLATEVDARFKAENETDPILVAMRAAAGDKQSTDIPLGAADIIWDALVACADQTKSSVQRAEALRVLAEWEGIRADNFRKQYLATQPVKAPQCQDLNSFNSKVKAAEPKAEAMGSYSYPDDLDQISVPLIGCVAESKKLNQGKPVPEFARAYEDLWKLTSWRDLGDENKILVEASSRAAQSEAAHTKTEDSLHKTLADPSALVTLEPEDKLDSTELYQVSEHNHALCDQIITVTRLTPDGLALEHGTPGGRKFLAEKYPRICLLENATRVAPGAPRYLLVYANSENAFAGFQPIQRITSSPISGSGTITNPYGSMWNFTFTGTMQTTETVDAPYVIQSRSLYLYAYDENGNVVSQHSVTVSSQIGGDPSYAAGYNTGALLSRLWNNPKGLAGSVLKDVQKDAAKYGRK